MLGDWPGKLSNEAEETAGPEFTRTSSARGGLRETLESRDLTHFLDAHPDRLGAEMLHPPICASKDRTGSQRREDCRGNLIKHDPG